MHIENQTDTKHVESTDVACLDEGSNPSGSTPKATILGGFFRYAVGLRRPARQARSEVYAERSRSAKKVCKTFF